MAKDYVFQLCDAVREESLSLHQHLRHGHLEKVYENGLAHRLRKRNLQVVQQHRLQVYDVDGTVLGDYVADIVVENCLLVELKAVQQVTDAHKAQLLGYLRGCHMEHGLLVNFGSPRLFIKKFVLSEA